jgi:hypothetical protein
MLARINLLTLRKARKNHHSRGKSKEANTMDAGRVIGFINITSHALAKYIVRMENVFFLASCPFDTATYHGQRESYYPIRARGRLLAAEHRENDEAGGVQLRRRRRR